MKIRITFKKENGIHEIVTPNCYELNIDLEAKYFLMKYKYEDSDEKHVSFDRFEELLKISGSDREF